MYWPIIALFLGSLSIGTTEFVISGILPAVASDMEVPISTAALLVTGYALGVAIGGPILTLLSTRFPRKLVTLAVLLLFIAGHVLCATASGYTMLMLGRIVAAAAHGCYFGAAVVLATLLAPKDKVGTALSILFAGISIANIIGVPLGTAIGNAFGWRASFVLVTVMASGAFLGVLLLVPSDGPRSAKAADLGAQVRALLNRSVGTSYLLIILMMIAFWSFSTFIAPFDIEVVGLPAEWLPAALLGGGVVATVGIFLGGRLADSAPIATLQWSYPALALTCALTWALGGLWLPLGLASAMFLVFPLVVVSTTVQNRVLVGAREAPDLASTLISSVFNIGIAVGSWLGATAVAGGLGYANLPLIGVAFALIAAMVAYVAANDDRKARAAGPAAAVPAASEA